MADARYSIPLSEFETAFVEDGAVLELTYLAPTRRQCDGDQTAYMALVGERFGIVQAGTRWTFLHERVGEAVWRARVAISRSGRLADFVPLTLHPCGKDVSKAYRLQAIHRVGTQNVVQRGITNTLDILEHQSASDLAGFAGGAAAKGVQLTLSVIVDALLPLLIPVGLFVLFRDQLRR